MTRQQRNNDRVIDNAIRKLMERKDKIVEAGFLAFMQSAMDYLVDVHNSSDHHVNEDSTLACGVIHNGSVVRIWGHKGTEQVKWKKATVRLQAIVPELPQEGWVGVLLSGMKGWYNVEKEMQHLTDTVSWSKDNFAKYFKPYTVR
jgi:hypothetical protein